ncbi:hypothetical protein KBX71_00435 [Micromonospora sp. D93]|uniref:hypothetical protein n=1 Tax=Micromonospora sp. D93 TaxID=2824886 RepID=UPI001B39A1B1|nr:hypothetical protein [Micromonospora sp. D93]MBQ1016329.1 hypothetical protein [Micromonospora sp. D93]
MTTRNLPALGILLVAVVLTAGCGSDDDRSPNATPSVSSEAAPTDLPTPPASPSPGVDAATSPPAAAQGTTQRRPASPPPVVLPKRPATAPGAKQIVEAFRAAGLKVSHPKDRAVDCGPDGLGLGCSELMATDAVTVYVFPDETSASDIAETWAGQSYQRGAVVLNYLEAKTPAADRPRYEKVLNGLR